MKYLIISFLLVLSSEIKAQETEQVNIYNSTLQIGEMVNLGNQSLKFKNVVTDSRCPQMVTCIWAGEAIVAVEIYEDGKCIEEKLIFVAQSHIPLEFSTENTTYSISGINLSPVPLVKNKALNEEYKLFMRVKESVKI